jgi:DNA-binding transcriptional LysR family regulator
VELRQLQYLRHIARVSGFRRAADELDMSQATLSEQIKLLEQELGVRLFERGGRSLTLTTAGRTLLQRAERILEEVKAAQEEMLDFARLDRGQLIVGTMTGNGPFWLPGFLAAFMRQHPHLELTLVERPSGTLLNLLQSGDVHVACILIPTDGPTGVPVDISTRQVYCRDLLVVVAPHHRFARRTSITLEEVADERLILTSPEEAPRRVVERVFAAHSLQPQVSFEADDPMTLIGLASEGIAIGITGANIARANGDRVVSVPIDGVQMRYSMALAWSERGPHTRARSTFLDFASEWLTEWGSRTHAQSLLSAPAID